MGVSAATHLASEATLLLGQQHPPKVQVVGLVAAATAPAATNDACEKGEGRGEQGKVRAWVALAA